MCSEQEYKHNKRCKVGELWCILYTYTRQPDALFGFWITISEGDQERFEDIQVLRGETGIKASRL